MSGKVKRDSDPKNDYSDGYSAGRRYFSRLLNKLLRRKK